MSSSSLPQSTAACSIITRNYLPAALAMYDKLCILEPKLSVFIYLVDSISTLQTQQKLDGNITVLCRDQFSFSSLVDRISNYYTSFEQCNALRPWAVSELFYQRHFQKVIYLDTDLLFLSSLDEAWRLLNEFACILSPHILTPYFKTEYSPNELTLAHYGTYNSGFMGFSNVKEVQPILHFLCEKMLHFAFFAPPSVYGGQELLDLVASLFRRSVGILEHPGYNIAFWNAHERHLELCNGRVFSNGLPAVFFHLSNYDWSYPKSLTGLPGLNSMVSSPALIRIIEEYRSALLRAYGSSEKLPSKKQLSNEHLAKLRYRYFFKDLGTYESRFEHWLLDPVEFGALLMRQTNLLSQIGKG